jgi:hypothetical protein
MGDGLIDVDERQARMAQNEALFRDVNERVEDVAAKFGDNEGGFEYFWECANNDCAFRVVLSIDQYESVREDSKQFIVLPDHFTPEVEEVVFRADSYWVVLKFGEGRRIC